MAQTGNLVKRALISWASSKEYWKLFINKNRFEDFKDRVVGRLYK